MPTPMIAVKVYAPNGADLGRLPTPQGVSLSYVLNDLGALKLLYPPQGPRTALLGQACELAVEFSPNNGVTWTEPPNSRFCYLIDGRDPLARTDHFQIDAKSYVWRFEKAKVLPSGLLNAKGKRAFNNATPGTILKTLFNEATARGALAGITHTSFSTTTDSAGVAWGSTLSIAYDPGLSYLTILQDLAAEGYIDFRMSGRAIQVYKADTAMAVDRTVGTNQVIFRAGRDLSDAPFRRTWEALANYAFFQGDEVSYEYTNPSADAPWGRMETFISNGQVDDLGTMAALTQNELALTDGERVEYTRGLDFTRAVSMPTVDYNAGDYVWSSVDGQAPDRLRLRQLTLVLNEKNILTGAVVLNDRFLEADIRTKRRIDGITRGASAGPGTGSPPGETTDNLPPAQVVGLTANSAAYTDAAGETYAQVTLAWSAVTTNSDGTAAEDIDHYEIFRRLVGSAVGSERNVGSTTDLDWMDSPYTKASQHWFRVVAVDRTGNRGARSAEVSITMASDSTAPQAPSAPVITQRLGTVHIFWDGLPVTGSWPLDFDSVEVHVSSVNAFTPTTTTIYHYLYGEGATVYASGAYGTPQYVKLVAVDKNGNKSVPSAQGSATPAQLVNADLINDIVDARLLGPGSVDTAAIQDLAVGTANMKDLSVVNAKIALLAVNNANIADLNVGKLTAGIMTAVVTVSGSFNTALTGDRVTFDSTGIRAIRGGVTTVSITSTGNATFTGEITGSTITGGLIRTAASGSRLELDNAGGLLSIRDDGTFNFGIVKATTSSGEPGFDGAYVGVGASLRFMGGTAGGFIGKNNSDRKMLIRSHSSAVTGAGIDLFDANSLLAADGDGHAYANSIRFYAESGATTLKLLANSVIVMRNGFIAPDMRIVTYSGGIATGPFTTTVWQPITDHVGTTFVGPPSGIVVITLTVLLRSANINVWSMAGLDIRSGATPGTGTVHTPVIQITANGNPGWVNCTGHQVVTGLTRGTTYSVKAVFTGNNATAGNTVFASTARLTVVPSP